MDFINGNYVTIVFVLIIVGNIIRLNLSKRKNDSSNHDLAIQNPEFTARPLRQLTDVEKIELNKRLKQFTLTYNNGAPYINIGFYIAGLFYLILCVIIINNFAQQTYDYPTLLITIPGIYALIKLFINRKNYYVDLHSPVFITTGKIRSENHQRTTRYFLKDIELSSGFRPTTNINGIENFVQVEYSPHSKHAWRTTFIEPPIYSPSNLQQQ